MYFTLLFQTILYLCIHSNPDNRVKYFQIIFYYEIIAISKHSMLGIQFDGFNLFN